MLSAEYGALETETGVGIEHPPIGTVAAVGKVTLIGTLETATAY